jgi:acetate kinase
MQTILVVNAGSSSLKFQVFAAGADDAPQCQIRGQVDGIGTSPRLRATDAHRKPLADTALDTTEVGDVAGAVRVAAGWLRSTQDTVPTAVGHRVVHGGPAFAQPVLVDTKTLQQLEQYIPLAPLHQPNNLATIRSILERMPTVPQVACFDTAFHRSHDALADHYAIPDRFYRKGVRRYGFHGLSYEYVAARLRDVAPDVADGRVIIAHLGSGASMCAISGGRSVESTMGFTALDGLPMGTRPGQLDPGVILYLIEQEKMTAGEVSRLLYGECGLKGLSGVSNDVRKLDESPDPRAAFALEFFAYRVALHAGQLAAALGGLDAFVFTAGIGENSASMRKRIADRLVWLGATLDPAANDRNDPVISATSSIIPLLVIPTDEELMIAKHTFALLSQHSAAKSQGALAI